GADEIVLGPAQLPRALPAASHPLFLHVGADIEVELDQQGAVVALLRLELIDLVEHAWDRFLGGPAEHSVVEHAPVPAAEEDRRVAGARQLAPEAGEPVAFAGFASVERGGMDADMAWVECRSKLAQRHLLGRALQSL